MVDHIKYRDHMLSDNTAALPGLRQFSNIIDTAVLGFPCNKQPCDVINITVVNKSPVRIDIAVIKVDIRQACALDGQILFIGILVGRSGRDGNISAASRVNHGVRCDNNQPLRCREQHTFDTARVDQRTATHGAKPDVTAGFANLPPVPFRFPVNVRLSVLVFLAWMLRRRHVTDPFINFAGEAFPVTIPVDADAAHRLGAAQTMKVFGDQCSGAMTGCADAGIGTGCPSADNDYVVRSDHRYKALSQPEAAIFYRRPDWSRFDAQFTGHQRCWL